MHRPQPIRLGLTALALLMISSPAPCQDKKEGPSSAEGRLDQAWWMGMHRSFLDRAKAKAVDVLFLGDSITQGWDGNGSRTWERYYVPRNAANFGIGGDRTQHVLWRIDHDELHEINPKVVVLMIGTNNLGSNPPEEIAGGVNTIVAELREKLPMTKILLLGVFPRGRFVTKELIEKTDRVQVDPRIDRINERIIKLDDGKMVKYLDIGGVFLDADGQIPKSLMPDYLHLSESGYRKWAEAMEPTLEGLMR